MTDLFCWQWVDGDPVHRSIIIKRTTTDPMHWQAVAFDYADRVAVANGTAPDEAMVKLSTWLMEGTDDEHR